MEDKALAGRTVGIVGGSGALGSAIARGLLRSGLPPRDLWISNRSGQPGGLGDAGDVQVTTRNQALVEACDVVVLSVPPDRAGSLAIDARDRLVVSVMAGVTVERIGRETGAGRVVRAMSSPAAARRLAYSPWFAGPGVTEADRAAVGALLGSCGVTDEVPEEAQIDLFTALTGPVPGFVAYFAECMAAHAVGHGVDPALADRAVRQLFHASGIAMATGAASPGEHVREMIDYAGTTAAGLEAMRKSPLAESIGRALDAAAERARAIG